MSRIIQKFGGTSVANENSRQKVLEKIISAKKAGDEPIVVVSAMGRKGDPYATDTLIDFVTSTAGKMSNREYDMLLSCGEIISAVVIATLLTNHGYSAKAFTGGQSGIITDKYHKHAELVYVKPELLLECLSRNIIPVVAGFQGMSKDGEITTLGRGGSDTTASMLGGALKAARIEIYTDVDGIMTADPNICEKAKIIPSISYNEVFQMADSGAKVIHPHAVTYAMRAGIPLVIKNTFSDEPGTFIIQNSDITTENSTPHMITSIAHRTGRVQYKVEDNEEKENNLLEIIAKENISIDLINVFPLYKVFTIDKEFDSLLREVLQKENFKYEVIEGCCKITLIGERMTGIPGVMSRIVKVLNKNGIQILQTADSLSTIACLIKQEHLKLALTSLHDEFDLS